MVMDESSIVRDAIYGRDEATERAAWAVLCEIADPELPTLSLVDLGMIRRVRLDGAAVHVELMPTFLGCPALAMMESIIEERLGVFGTVHVEIVRDEAWTTDRITPAGREKLLAAGLAPPPPGALDDVAALSGTPCPYCGSADTVLHSPFGPTPCRAVHYCRACRQPFEQFKPV